MAAVFGAVRVECPACGSDLQVPVHAGGPLATECPSVVLHVDADYLRAHWLTHGQHDGEPMPAAA